MFNTSSKKESFLFLVQSMLLVACSHQSSNKQQLMLSTARRLADLIALDESWIPDNIITAAEEYVAWQDGWTKGGRSREKYPRPAWFNPPSRSDGYEGFKYPWEK